MKKAIGLLAVIVLFVMSSATASAQMKFGVQGGANFSTMKIKSISTSNAAGWYLGPTLEMLLPVVGLGVEGSFWYSRVNTEAKVLGVKKDMHFNYFTIPVNLKYKIQIPMFSPFAFVGPEFQLKLKDNLNKVYGDLIDKSGKGYTMGLNCGFGVELFNSLQVSLGYNWGLSNAIQFEKSKQHTLRLGMGVYF